MGESDSRGIRIVKLQEDWVMRIIEDRVARGRLREREFKEIRERESERRSACT